MRSSTLILFGLGIFLFLSNGLSGKSPGTWKLPENPEEITAKFWRKLPITKMKTLHYNRNRYQKDAGIPLKESDLVKSEWKCMGVALAHNIGKGVSGNKDYRGIGKRKGQQAVYDSKGNLVTTHENKGTYDFISPEESMSGHILTDVIPWVIWGNSPPPQDKSTLTERAKTLASSTTEKGMDEFNRQLNKYLKEIDRVERFGAFLGEKAKKKLVEYLKDYLKEYMKKPPKEQK
jgi:hypothetical protein